VATTTRVGVGGWRQGDDSTAQARVGVGGWYQVVAVSTSATYTLTSVTYVPGSLTSTSVTPRIVRAKA
jgi:hypothetical protein